MSGRAALGSPCPAPLKLPGGSSDRRPSRYRHTPGIQSQAHRRDDAHRRMFRALLVAVALAAIAATDVGAISASKWKETYWPYDKDDNNCIDPSEVPDFLAGWTLKGDELDCAVTLFQTAIDAELGGSVCVADLEGVDGASQPRAQPMA